MISAAASLNDAVSVTSDTHSATTRDDASAAGFSEIFSSVSGGSFQKPRTERAAGDETTQTGDRQKDTEETPEADAESICRLMQLIGQYANPEHQALAATTQETITGVLEGNGVSGDMDIAGDTIASALTELRNCFSQLGSGEKEAILARMPQATMLFEEPDSAATPTPMEAGSISCPLENLSEHSGAPLTMQVQTGPRQDAGVPAGRTAEQTADSNTGTAAYVRAEAAAGEAGTSIQDAASYGGTQQADQATEPELSGIPAEPVATEQAAGGTAAASSGTEGTGAGTEAAGIRAADGSARTAADDTAGEAGDGETPSETGIREVKKDARQAAPTEDADSRDYSDVEGAASAANPEAPGTGAHDGVRTAAGNALTKLTDIFSAYDGSENNRFEIQLEPENLGKLSISLTMGEDGLRALIRTKDSQVHSLLSSEISLLADKLSENGVQIKSLDVVCSDMGGESFDSQYSGNAHAGQDAPSYGNRRPEDVQSAYEELGSTQIYAWANEELIGSTVSYRA